MQNLRTAWYLMHCRWEVLSSEQKQFIATFSDAIISETKNIFGIFFFAYSKLRSDFEHFQKKKNDPDGWYIFELTDAETRG